MEIEVSIFIDKEGKPQLLDKERPLIKDFYSKRKGQWAVMVLRDEEDIRSNNANKFLWACYSYFIPDNFDSTDEVHEYFTRKFLRRDSLFESDKTNLQKELEKLRKEARRIISAKIIDDKIEIVWIKSTTRLNKKQFSEYTENVIREGNQLGIEFPEQ
jgi:hypothetical protein